MADFSTSLLEFRSLSFNFHYKLHLKYFSTSLVPHTYNSRIIKIKRNPFHFNLLCKPSSLFDVISTHEHSDGSVLFRFGDPSEIVEDVRKQEEIEDECKEEYNSVKVFDGDHEREVIIIKKPERVLVGRNLAEIADESTTTNSIICDESSVGIVFERENKSSDEILEEGATKFVDNIVYEDREGLSEEVVDHEREVIIIKKPERVIVGSNLAEIAAESTTSNSLVNDESSISIVLEEGATKIVDNVGYEDREGLSEEGVVPSQENVVVIDKISEVETIIATTKVTLQITDVENEIEGDSLESKSSDELLTPPLSVMSLSKEAHILTPDVSVDSELKNSELKNEIHVDSKFISLPEEGKYQNLEVSVQNVVTGDENEYDKVDETVARSPCDLDVAAANLLTWAEAYSSITGIGIPNAIFKHNNDIISPTQLVVTDRESIPQSETGNDAKDGFLQDNQLIILKDESDSDGVQLMPEAANLRTWAEAYSSITGIGMPNAIFKHNNDMSTPQLVVTDHESTPQSETSNDTKDASQQDNQLIVLKDESDSDEVQSIPEAANLRSWAEAYSSITGIGMPNTIFKHNNDMSPTQLVATDHESTPQLVATDHESTPQLETCNDTKDVCQQDNQLIVLKDESDSDTVQLMPEAEKLLLDVELGEKLANLSEEVECQSLQAQVQNVVVGNESESEKSDNIMTKSRQLEGAINLTDDSSSIAEISTLNEILKDDGMESESKIEPDDKASPQLEADEPVVVLYGEETTKGGNDNLEEQLLHEADDSVVTPVTLLTTSPQNLVLETKTAAKDDDNVQSVELVEASKSEVTELEYTESATTRVETETTEFVLSSGAALFPHPSKVLTGGEDAYFVAGEKWLGVADGVSQWSLQEGTIPGVYAQDLLKNCEKLISDSNENSINQPLDLLNLSVSQTCSRGSSTVLIAKFDGQVLHVANIGDSGFIILRHGTVYKRSSPMLHIFHFPIQIERGMDPSHLAELYQVDLEEEDVIITATDGLLDNLYDREISTLVFKSLAAHIELKEIAELLGRKAHAVGRSASCRSPFADNAKAAGYVGYAGGKLDDVTVIVSVVKKSQSNSQTM